MTKIRTAGKKILYYYRKHLFSGKNECYAGMHAFSGINLYFQVYTEF